MNASRNGSDNRLGVALIGPGRIAVAHLAAIAAASDIARLVGVAGLPEELDRTRALAKRFDAPHTYSGLDEVFASPEVGAVVLTLPNHLHGPVAIKALEAGKHVLVEKPLTTSLAECDDMIAASRKANRVLMAGMCRRFFKGARMVHDRIAQIGRPVNVISILGVFSDSPRANWWASARDTGGLALGLNGPHVIDTMTWWIGAAPKRVYAQTQRYRPVWEGEDEASVMIDFEDGSMATGHVSLNMKSEINERVVVGPNGMMRLINDRELWIDGEKAVDEPVTPYIEGDVSFERQFREFAEAIGQTRSPVAEACEARPSVQVLEAALESARTHRPVEL